MFFTGLGNGWTVAVLDNEDEMHFIKQGQKGFYSHTQSYWIGGSTDAAAKTIIHYSAYKKNNSGANLLILHIFSLLH